VVPVAVAISMPVIWPITPAILVALPRLRRKTAPVPGADVAAVTAGHAAVPAA
jgi:hypothetical protein